MSAIHKGRFTAKTDQPFVLFLIGARINKIWAVRRWWPVMAAMGPMLAELYRHPEKGFLGGYTTIGSNGPVSVQYWRSFEDLERFARSPNDPHLPAWMRFYKASNDGSVGIWHETYLIQPDGYETVYANMPRFGLASVMEHVPAEGRRKSARTRLTANRAPTTETQASSKEEAVTQEAVAQEAVAQEAVAQEVVTP